MALPNRLTTIVVVPGGLGTTFSDQFAPCTVISGAKRGEAAVDFVLTASADRLLTSPHEVPVVAVLALVGYYPGVPLDALNTAIQISESWKPALSLWRRWRHRRNDEPHTFRATAMRSDDVSATDIRVSDIARAVASGTWGRWKWVADMSNYDAEVICVWLASGALIGLPLTPGWHACQRTGKGGFWPVEASRAQPSSHHNNCGPSQPILRPSVCFGLLQRAGLRPTDLLADPMCGVGSLPCEAIHRFSCSYALCGDNNRAAVRDAHRRSRALGTLSAAPVLDVARWDVRCLPLRSDLVDVLIVDMPWGNRGKAAPHLVREALAEVARVLAPGGRAVVLLVRAVAGSLERDGLLGGLRLVELLEVAVGGWPVAAVTLRKPAATLDGGVSSTSPPLPSYEPLTSAACCAVDVSEALSLLNLAEVLVAVWPEVVPSLSAARRAVRHRRVALAADPLRVLWWRMAAPLGERLVLRPHRQRLQPRESLLALHAAAPLQVLWEDDDDGRWMVAVKPAGMGVLQGRRSLANALLALQASRYEGAGGGGDGGGGAGGDEQQPPPQQQQPWTAAYDGPMRVGGAWLVAKTPRAALSVLEQAVEITLHWVAIFRGAPPLETLDACGLANVSVKRDGRSVRYGAIREATFTTGDADLWREAAAAAGFPVVGDRPHCDGPTACLWIRAVRMEGRDSSLLLPTPERFARLFEREEAVCQRRDRGELNSEYARRMLAAREAEDGEVDDVGEEEGGEQEEEEDGEWGAGPEGEV